MNLEFARVNLQGKLLIKEANGWSAQKRKVAKDTNGSEPQGRWETQAAAASPSFGTVSHAQYSGAMTCTLKYYHF